MSPSAPERDTTVGPTAREVRAELAAATGDAVAAGRILAHALGVPLTSIAVDAAASVPAPARDRALDMARRCAEGEPLQHVLGTWGFRSLDLVVDARALVPRPETEQLVDLALTELAGRTGRGGSHGSPLVAVDLGTGSGVIALSLVHEGPVSLEVWATDRSEDALGLARCNLERLAATDPGAAARVQLGDGSWFEPLPMRLRGSVDVVVSNPPYVSEAEWEQLDPVVRDHDPYMALVPGPTGLEALAQVVDESFEWLAPGGSLALELAPWQADEVCARARARGYGDARAHLDLTGRPRFVVARRPPA